MNNNFWSKKIRDEAARAALEAEQERHTKDQASTGPGLGSKDEHKARLQQLKRSGGNSLILSSLLCQQLILDIHFGCLVCSSSIWLFLFLVPTWGQGRTT